MLNQIFSKLFTGNREEAMTRVVSLYKEKGSAIIHFLYFANIVLNGLEKKELSSGAQNYANALLDADVLLPDGIALRLLAKKRIGRELANLNGTDFLPFFLSKLAQSGKSSSIVMYGASSEVVDRAKKFLVQTTSISIIGTCDGFRELDLWILDRLSGEFRILLVGRGSPRQECWVETHRQELMQRNILVFTVGGLFDFWAGTEKRAPAFFQSLKLEWLWRVLTNPKKNAKKAWVSFQIFPMLLGIK